MAFENWVLGSEGTIGPKKVRRLRNAEPSYTVLKITKTLALSLSDLNFYSFTVRID